MIEHSTQNIYDEIPYPRLSFTQTHPDRLATLATLRGMDPPNVEHCRVLELGCASGGNLVPMAQGLPQSEFVGVDLSARQIAEGQATVQALGLNNVTFRRMDILDPSPDLGQFDYVIAHGVYSWVPAPVQDQILEICKQNLAPRGVAYVSYNTYPGWHMLDAVRDMMRYHTRQVSEPHARAAQARDLIDFMARSVPAEDNPYGSFLRAYVKFFRKGMAHGYPEGDALLIHDELSEVNTPVYFYQFAERAARHGLQYLAEANFRSMLASNFPPQVCEALRHMVKDTIELEQYMDFLRNRTFRQTLLCHQEVVLDGAPRPECLARFYVASPAWPVEPELDVHSDAVAQFRTSDGAVLSTDHPLTKSAMLCLAQVWPRPLSFRDLLRAAQARLNGAPSGDVQVLGANLLQAFGYSENLVELHVYAPRFVRRVTECPLASPVARFQAQNGVVVTNVRHERVNLDEMGHHLLTCLDGRRDRAALLEALMESVARGVLTVQREGGQVARDVLDEVLDAKLERLANAALLVG
jgi:methyltransferase-like protein/SAM-dependent methyltransferase